MSQEAFRFFGDVSIAQAKRNVALTFGNFDGVHLGHRALLEQLKERAAGMPLAVLTFDPHPTQILSPARAKPQITTLERRVALLLENGVDSVVVRTFDEAFSNVTADEFCEQCLAKFTPNFVMPGQSVTYGKNREGDIVHLRKKGFELGFRVEQATVRNEGSAPISSTRVRDAISAGDVTLAEDLLGRCYVMEGYVGHGDKVARQLGVPTANLAACSTVQPAPGVYACLVQIGDEQGLRPAVASCGYRPSTTSEGHYQMEAHIFDFDKNIYDQKIAFHLKKFIRKETKFESLETLKANIANDVTIVRSYFNL